MPVAARAPSLPEATAAKWQPPSPEELAATDAARCLQRLQTGSGGLSSSEAAARLARFGRNELETETRSFWRIVAEQGRSGINVLLALAGVLTIVTGDLVDGAIILTLLGINIGLSIFQEYRAELALSALRAMLPLQALARRDGVFVAVPAALLVPGDVIRLRSGDVVPADVRLLECTGIEIDQATLTGESVPQEKTTDVSSGSSPAEWRNMAFAGTVVVAGDAVAVVSATGSHTQFGETASLVKGIHAPGDFQTNLNHFSSFLLRFGLLVAAGVFASNALLGRGVLVSATLALAVALGVVPEALPAVTATTLALGAQKLARKHVLVRRLAAVEDFSAIDTLCIDKTGTITENRTAVTQVWSLAPRAEVLEAAVLASSFPEKGTSIIDDAVMEAAAPEVDLHALAALPRTLIMPFDANTKRMAARVDRDGSAEIVTKGAAAVVEGLCTRIRTAAGEDDLAPHAAEVAAAVEAMQRAGCRVLGVASQAITGAPAAADAAGMTLLGLIGLSDPPRPGAAAALRGASQLGVAVKIVTGDAIARARALAGQIGLRATARQVVPASALKGEDISAATSQGVVFAEVVPADKYRLVTALQHQGRHVAVTGDGVNDAPALQSADVGIALATGTDATKGAADMILLQDDLAVIVDGLKEGRRTFTNINRYLLYTMVSNFANVVIVAIASLFLSYLPLLPTQVLLLNVLADLPMLAIVTDTVSDQDISSPRRWDIRHLMVLSVFLGIVNALFAFGMLRFIHEQDPAVVRTSWFLFLGTTALIILFAVRSRRWFWSRPWPSRPVLLALAAAFIATVALINVPFAQRALGFAQLGALQQLEIVGYAVAYLVVASVLKQSFDRQASQHQPSSAAGG
ncbi:MAG: cation-transporting P-type ATPase [Candidatus Dormibacteraeota bacterium]|nr:cation-transporting P-type ATPase [Candidatus Dormibacteraeota bacterium]